MAGQRQPFSAAGADDDTYGSTSTLSTETTTGSQVLTVLDYAGNKAFHAAGGAPRQTNMFTIAGFLWRIIFSTHGSSADTRDWICIGLICLDPPAAAAAAAAGMDDIRATMVRTSYTLLDHAGQPLPSTMTADSARALSTMSMTRSIMTPFMKRQRLESSSYLKDDTFRVRFDVAVVACTCRVSEVLPPPSDLRRHLGELLASGVGADVTLEVGGEEFHAHRSVLAARSPVFRAELLGGRQEEEDAAAAATTTNRVMSVNGIEPSLFKALLHFLYTDSLPEIEDGQETVTARLLLVAAERFGLQGLKWICEDILYEFD